MGFTQSGVILHRLVYNIAGEKYKDFVTIVFGWKNIVGKLLSERSFVEKLENKILFVSVKNNVWLQELILQKNKLLSDINFKLKIKIEDIRFFIKSNKTSGNYYRK